MTALSERIVWQDMTAVEVHVVLQGIEPLIWRRLVVPLRFTLADLHRVIQAAFGWTDSHLHEFRIGGLRFGDAAFMEAERIDDFDARTFEAADVQLNDFGPEQGTAFDYVYDFGDNWVHRVTLEKRVQIAPIPKTATCLAGARSGPPEDVGSASGYAEFVRILLRPEADEREEQRNLKHWSGGKFDPERFDLARTDKAVRGALRKRRRLE